MPTYHQIHILLFVFEIRYYIPQKVTFGFEFGKIKNKVRAALYHWKIKYFDLVDLKLLSNSYQSYKQSYF